jgi:polyhydroxyalkanoate synthesis regulator phasin
MRTFLSTWIYSAAIVLSGVLAGFALSTVITSCGVQASDIQAFAASQERSNEKVAIALTKLNEGVISPQEAKLVVDSAIKDSQKATAATLTKMQDDILAWWQVASIVISGTIPIVGAGLALLNRSRNASSEARVAVALDKLLADRGLTPPKS